MLWLNEQPRPRWLYGRYALYEHYQLMTLGTRLGVDDMLREDQEALTLAIQTLMNGYQQFIGRARAEEYISMDPREWMELCEDGCRLMVVRDPMTFLHPYRRRS